jgi:chromosome segregation ATPase
MKTTETSAAAETLALRREAAAKIAALQREAGALAGTRKELDTLGEKLARLDREREAVRLAMNTKRQELMGDDERIQSAIRQQEAELRATASPALAEASAFVQDKLSDLRRPGRLSRLDRFDCLAALTDAVNYCLGALRELESMALAPEVDFPRITALKAGIPIV